MAKAYAHLKTPQRIVAFGRERVREIEEEMRALQSEKIMWEAIIGQQGLCEACDGEGKVRVMIAQDETSLEPCHGCKGTGKCHEKA